jgi:HD-GYP domain-containing protein (c-di-GMP phosphodiesterase class II)
LKNVHSHKNPHRAGRNPQSIKHSGWRARLLPELNRWFEKRPGGIRFKLAVVTLSLIALITAGSSLVVIRILDEALLQSLVQRGRSLAVGAATPAGYSILSGDILALDNLASKSTEAQDDVAYLAILDQKETVLAHNRLEAAGGLFERLPGTELSSAPDVTVRKVFRDGRRTFEFRAPIRFAGRHIGEVVVGIDSAPYRAAKASARNRMALVSLLALGVGLTGSLLLAARFTLPIQRLAAGVSRIRSGDYDVQVDAVSRDELAELTTSFNAMARTIRAQKESLEGSARELEEAYVSTVRILAAALDARDNYTLNHSARVATLSLRVGRRLGLGQNELRELEMACFLHDIGKIRVPDVVLNKPGRLDAEEAGLIRRHPEQGAEILGLAQSLHKFVPVVLHHHEWYDGSGYPGGLKGEDIPLFAQIVSIADAYDAMTSSRPYRPGRSLEEAIQEIRDFRGRQFAPGLADLFIEALREETEEEVSFIGATL